MWYQFHCRINETDIAYYVIHLVAIVEYCMELSLQREVYLHDTLVVPFAKQSDGLSFSNLSCTFDYERFFVLFPFPFKEYVFNFSS